MISNREKKLVGGDNLVLLFSLCRPRVLEMDKEENRRSVILPRWKQRSSSSSETLRRRSHESVAGYSGPDDSMDSPRRVKMRRH